MISETAAPRPKVTRNGLKVMSLYFLFASLASESESSQRLCGFLEGVLEAALTERLLHYRN